MDRNVSKACYRGRGRIGGSWRGTSRVKSIRRLLDELLVRLLLVVLERRLKLR